MKKIRKGMILSAGLGTRLLPITKKHPKPIVPVLNVANALHNLFLFREAGVEEIILNLHHLGKEIEKFLGNGSRYGVKLSYSNEEVLLGTGGGVKKVESFFEKETFLLANCDFVTNVDLRPHVAKHFERDALATMILFEDKKRQAQYSSVGVNAKGELCQLPKMKLSVPNRAGIFSGIHIIDSHVLSHLKAEPSGINDVLYPKLMSTSPNRVFGDFFENGYWYDTGDMTALWTSSMELLDKLIAEPGAHLGKCLKAMGDYEEGEQGIWIRKDATVPGDLKIVPPVIIGKGIQFGAGVTVGPHAILGDGAQLADRSTLSRVVVLSGAVTEPNESVRNVILLEK